MTESKCFAEVNGKCILLTCKKCRGNNICSFYKNEEQVKAEKQKTFERIATLPIETQIYISAKFYSDKMPWRVKG